MLQTTTTNYHSENLGNGWRRTVDVDFQWRQLDQQTVKGVGLQSEMFLRARENMYHQSGMNKLKYDLRREESKFKVGNEVMLTSHTISNLDRAFSVKLAARWRGPFVIREQLSPVISSQFHRKMVTKELLMSINSSWYFKGGVFWGGWRCKDAVYCIGCILHCSVAFHVSSVLFNVCTGLA